MTGQIMPNQNCINEVTRSDCMVFQSVRRNAQRQALLADDLRTQHEDFPEGTAKTNHHTSIHTCVLASKILNCLPTIPPLSLPLPTPLPLNPQRLPSRTNLPNLLPNIPTRPINITLPPIPASTPLSTTHSQTAILISTIPLLKTRGENHRIPGAIRKTDALASTPRGRAGGAAEERSASGVPGGAGFDGDGDFVVGDFGVDGVGEGGEFVVAGVF